MHVLLEEAFGCCRYLATCIDILCPIVMLPSFRSLCAACATQSHWAPKCLHEHMPFKILYWSRGELIFYYLPKTSTQLAESMNF